MLQFQICNIIQVKNLRTFALPLRFITPCTLIVIKLKIFKILIFSFNNYYGEFTHHELHIAHLLNIKSHLHFLNLAYSNKKYRRNMEKMSICIKTIKNYLSIAVTICQLVKVKQGLVDTLLQLEGYLHGVKSCSPLITVRFLKTNSMFYYIQSFIEK